MRTPPNAASAPDPLTGIAQTLTQGSTSIQATYAGVTGATTVQVAGSSFVPVGNLLTPRAGHTATLLPTGKVLLTGGYRFGVLPPLSSAEVFNPATRTFEAAPPLITGRFGHTATLLPNGRVLIVGGNTLQFVDYILPTPSAEIYDPVAGTITATGSLQYERAWHRASLLPGGRVLIAGGGVGVLEVYDLATGLFTSATDSIPLQTDELSATSLSDGNVLLAGGACYLCAPTSTASLYSAINGGVTAVGTLATPSRNHAAGLLGDGSVVIAGGLQSDTGPAIGRAEVFNPATGLFSAAPALALPRGSHTATSLPDGAVLVVGGSTGYEAEVAPAERFDPVSRTWFGAGATSAARVSHTATLLADGTVLVAGGYSGNTLHAYGELYGPALPSPTSLVITPATVTLQPGNTRQYTVVDELGRARHEAAWSTSDVTTATIGAFGSPVLTAVDYGQVTVMATIGSVSAQATVVVAPLSLQVTPAVATMPVGEARQFTVVDDRGKPTTRATWMTDAPALATLSGAGRLTVTAVAPGTATITATVQGVTASATLSILSGTSLSPGTVRWSTASIAGATSRQLVQAGGGGPGGPAVLSVQSTPTQTYLQGLTADGEQLWQTRVVGPVNQVSSNGRGGLLLTMFMGCDNVNAMRIVSIDAATGDWAWDAVGASTCTSDLPHVATRHDGSVSITTPGNLSGFPSFMVLDGVTGNPLAVPSVPKSTFTSVNGQQTQGYSRVGPAMVDPSGATYFLYEVRTVAYPPVVTQTAIWMMKVEADRTWTTTQIATTNVNVNQFPGRILPDDQGGVVVTWTYMPVEGGPDPTPLRAAHVSRTGTVTPYPLPIQPASVLLEPNAVPVNPMLSLGENDTAFASYGPHLVSFNLNTGVLTWTYTASAPVTIVSSDSQNGVFAKATASGTDTVVRFDATGSPTSTSWTAAALDYMGQAVWLGTNVASSAIAYVGGNIDATSVYPSPMMGRTNAAKKFFSNFNRIELTTPVTPDYVFNTFLRTFRGVNNSSVADVKSFAGGNLIEPTNISAVGQTLRFTLEGLVGWLQGAFDVITVRFDPASRVIVAETVNIPSNYHGHPLFGWRYWKVFQQAPGEIVVETGALSRPALEFDPVSGTNRWMAFVMDKWFFNQELTLWKDMLNDVNTGLNQPPPVFPPGSQLKVPQSAPGVIGGLWDWMDKRYILKNLCGEVPPFAIPSICY